MSALQIFLQVKPLCEEIVRDPTEEAVTALCKEIITIENENLQTVQRYMIYPFMVHLSGGKCSQDLKTHLLNGLTTIFSCTQILSYELLSKLHSLIFFFIYDTERVSANSTLSEEIKLSVLKCAIQLIKSSTSEVIHHFYSNDNVKEVSLGLLIAINIAASEKYATLIITALEYLYTVLSQNDDNLPNITKKYLPGLVKPLSDISQRNETQPHRITQLAIRVLGQSIILVMTDKTNESCELSDEEVITKWKTLCSAPQKKVVEDVISILKSDDSGAEWISAAAQVLSKVISNVLDVKTHSHYKVRLELVKVASRMLENCSQNLHSSVTSLLELLIASTEDSHEAVAKESHKGIQIFSEKVLLSNRRLLNEMISENVYNLSRRMPRELHTGNSDKSISTISLLTGYLKLLQASGELTTYLNVSSHLEHLSSALIIATELDTVTQSVVHDVEAWDDTSMSTNMGQWKRLTHFTDQTSAWLKLSDICRQLRDVDSFLDDLLSRRKRCLSADVVLSLTLRSSTSLPDNVCKNILNDLLDLDVLYPPLQITEDQCETAKELHENLMKVALVIECIGSLAVAMGPRFQDFTLKILHVVIEKIGSNFVMLRTTAIQSATEISKACGLDGTIAMLIKNNLDYLSYHVMNKLQKPRQRYSALDLVRVVAQYSAEGCESLTGLQDIVRSVLSNSSKQASVELTLSYLRVFHTFLKCVNVENSCISEDAHQDVKNSFDELLDGFIDFTNQKKETNEEETFDEEKILNNEQEEEPEEKKVEVPCEVKLTVEIAKRCLHYLSHPDRDVKLAALVVLNSAITFLLPWEDELLPLVHEIWAPLVLQFKKQTPEPLMVARSFELLVTMARVSKDFIRSRTLKQVLPSIRDFLIKSSQSSQLKDTGSGYQYTQTFKLQKQLLLGLGPLMVDLCLFERETENVMEAALPYLSRRQPKPLQESCKTLIQHLNKHDPYLTWVKLHPLTTQPEFSKNATEMLPKVT